MRPTARLIEYCWARLQRVPGVARALLVGGGAAAALALLPPDAAITAALRDSPEPRKSERAQALAAGETAPSGVGVGRLVAQRAQPRRAGRAYYRKTTSRRVPASAKAGFMPLYREAARTFVVSWRLLASIHRQETAFSTEPSTYHGLNAFGCCAGPMQFNVTNGPVSTWKLYRQSFRLGDRPRRYPHRTNSHPSVYDDFDAIMAAGALLRDSGAGEALDGGAWAAAYAYYGHDRFGTLYASQVMGRARGWERNGFCLNCPDDDTLVAAFDEHYGVEARRQLRDAERRDKQDKRKKRKKQDRAKARKRARERAKHSETAKRSERPKRDGARRPPKSPRTQTTPRPPAAPPPPAPEPPATPAATPQPVTPPPDASPCTRLSRLLGCGR